ncbi:MAG: pseudouridine synthase [Gammaproteobacteria bacterium]|nr:pseudouridine synthase [Gammaproteobacteria bacterium]MDH5171089.1 pseudouridine synthase [Gammaproteobacteria bacterium]
MRSRRTRLDRFLTARAGIHPRAVRPLLASGRVLVDGAAATGISQVIDQFTRVQLDDRVLQARNGVYIMLHKPTGVVSATRDPQHRTVIDLLARPDRDSLHIAGRLDYNSSGLLLLTNDGRWSRHLNTPGNAVRKRYLVTLEQPVSAEYATAFAEGMYFPYEGITTRPAQLRIIDDHTAEVVLLEGRYHQIRRMFGRFNNRVLALHRVAVGSLSLDPELAPGQYRELTLQEYRDSLAG